MSDKTVLADAPEGAARRDLIDSPFVAPRRFEAVVAWENVPNSPFRAGSVLYFDPRESAQENQSLAVKLCLVEEKDGKRRLATLTSTPDATFTEWPDTLHQPPLTGLRFAHVWPIRHVTLA